MLFHVVGVSRLPQHLFVGLDAGRVGVQGVLAVLREQELLRIESFCGDTGQEFFGDASAINTSFLQTKLVQESDLDWLFQTITKTVKLSERILEFILAANACMMPSKLGFLTAHRCKRNPMPPEIWICVSTSSRHHIQANKLAENLDSCFEGNGLQVSYSTVVSIVALIVPL
ncbi:hypothetical protein KCV06_g664, partial [Aureobasidium melanogenum]